MARYSEQQLNKAHDIITDMLNCAEEATKEEKNFQADVVAIEKVLAILEKCINEI